MSIGSCPHCRCYDIRQITKSGLDLIGYRCHDCQRTFYVAVTQIPVESRPDDPPARKTERGQGAEASCPTPERLSRCLAIDPEQPHGEERAGHVS